MFHIRWRPLFRLFNRESLWNIKDESCNQFSMKVFIFMAASSIFEGVPGVYGQVSKCVARPIPNSPTVPSVPSVPSAPPTTGQAQVPTTGQTAPTGQQPTVPQQQPGPQVTFRNQEQRTPLGIKA